MLSSGSREHEKLGCLYLKFAIINFDKFVIFLCKLFCYILVFSLSFFVEITFIVIPNEVNLVTSPPACKFWVFDLYISPSAFITLS